MVPGTENWGLKDWLEAGSYLVAILVFVATPLIWWVKRRFNSAKPSGPAAIDYPIQGRHGMNILCSTSHTISQNSSASMRAIIPVGREVRVRLRGPKPEYLDQTDGAWYYTLPPINWSADSYSEALGETFPIQTFTAETGTADLKITFARRGPVQIDVFENSDREPTWSKQITVTT